VDSNDDVRENNVKMNFMKKKSTTGRRDAEEAQPGSSMARKPATGAQQSPVLLELFTSQGCSSCPPADVKFARLGQGVAKDIAGDVPVITLAYHVDYWNHLGWQDPFAKSAWTQRQRSYGQVLQQNSIYTPELVVQGRAHCVGSDSRSVASLIQSAPRHLPAPVIHATFERTSPSTLRVSVTVSAKKRAGNDQDRVDVLVALYENGLVTECKAGENRRKLLTNEYVVRSLETACTLPPPAGADAVVTGQVLLQLWQSFSPSTTGIVIFLQNPVSKEVFGAQQFQLPHTL